MVKVGVTGGIGAGKSTIAKAFATEFNTPLYIMDNQTKYVINTNDELKKKLREQFGSDVFLEDGSYNTKLVSEVVFNNKEELVKFSANIAPHLQADYDLYCELHKNESYIIVESAYFFEYNIESMVDFMVGVNATLPIRLSRAQFRDNATYDQVMARMKNQMDHEEKMFLCDFIIENNDNCDFKQIDRLDVLFRKMNKLIKS